MSELTKEELITKLETLLRQRQFAANSDAVDKLHDAIVGVSAELAKFSTGNSAIVAPEATPTAPPQSFGLGSPFENVGNES